MANFDAKVKMAEQEVLKIQGKLDDKKRELERTAQKLTEIQREHDKIHDDVTKLTHDLAQATQKHNTALREQGAENTAT